MSGSHLALRVWCAPAFPVGAFAYSHGLEWAHEAGDLTDATSLEDWLRSLFPFGSAPTAPLPFPAPPPAAPGAALCAAPCRAAGAGDGARLAEIAALALALATSPERRLETTTQGDAFVGGLPRRRPPPTE